MNLTVDELVSQVLRLPVETRAQIVDQLVESLTESDANEIQELWTAEAMRRLEEIESGRAKTIPGEEVLAEVRRAVGRQ